MIYVYKCHTCDMGRVEVWKPASEFGRKESCPQCHTVMDRVFTVPMTPIIKKSEYNIGLGSSKSLKQVNQERALAGKSELIEVGNDRMDSVKPKPCDYSFTKAEQAGIARILDHA